MKVYKLKKKTLSGNVRRFLWGVLGMAIMLMAAGCMTVGPDYTAVEPDAPSGWNTELMGGLVQGENSPEDMANWWECLGDETLSALEVRVASGNLELKAAESRLLQARALRGVSQASLFPTLSASGAITSYHTSPNGSSGMETEHALYSGGFDAAWEVDLFGGVRRAVEASQANLEAAREDYRDVMVSMLAEVALNYIEVRTYQARLASTQENIAAQQKVYELNRSRFEAGMISELAMQQSRYGLEQSRASMPTLESGLAAAKNRLAVLVGEKPGALDDLLEASRPIPVLPPSVVVGVPADTLRNRPDIRKAERQLAAQTARVGVATADLYPKIQLAGTVGLQSIYETKVLDLDSKYWSAGPSASWSIFNAGAVRQNIAVQSALVDQALISYQSAVLSALEEVENVLTAYAKEQNRHEYLSAAITAARRADELAREQYQAGLVDFSNVLDTQQALLSLADTLAQNEGAMVSNLVRLYKAFGGGWVSEE